MPKIPRALQQVSATATAPSLRRVSAEDLGAATGRSLEAAGGLLFDKGQRVLQREGETLAMEQFSAFQKNELLRLAGEKQARVQDPEGFTDDFTAESKTRFDAILQQSDNKFFQETMQSRFVGLTNSLLNSSVSFEAHQKVFNQKARYAATIGSYSSAVYSNPEMLVPILNQAAGDAASAGAHNFFGEGGVSLATKGVKQIATSAIWGIIDQDPEALDALLKKGVLKGLFTGKEINSFKDAARNSFKTLKDRREEERVMADLAVNGGVMKAFEDGTLTTSGIASSGLSDESKVWMIKAITEGDVDAQRDPIFLDQLWTEKNEIFGIDKKSKELKLRETKGFFSKKDELVAALSFQNKIIQALGEKKITGGQANSLLRGISLATQKELSRDRSKQNEFTFFGKIKATPDDLAFKALSQHMKDNDLEQGSFEKSRLMAEIIGEFNERGVYDVDNKEDQRDMALAIIEKTIGADDVDRNPLDAINQDKTRSTVSRSGVVSQNIGEAKAKPTQKIKSKVIRQTLPNGNIIEIDLATGNYVVIKGGD